MTFGMNVRIVFEDGRCNKAACQMISRNQGSDNMILREFIKGVGCRGGPRAACWHLLFMIAATVNVTSALAEAFEVIVSEQTPSPRDGQTDVSCRASVQLNFSDAIDPDSLSASAIMLLDAGGDPVAAYLQSDLTGGIVTIAPTRSLEPGGTYTVHVTKTLKNKAGTGIRPYTMRFSTTAESPAPDPNFLCELIRIDERDHNSCLAVGPDGHLYVANTFGQIKRYALDPRTGQPTGQDVPYVSRDDQIVGMCFDPDTGADNLVLWISYARYGGQFSGSVARVVLPRFGMEGKSEKSDYIMGLPHDKGLHHQPNGITFGPDGRMYISVGGVSTLGGTPNWGMDETVLSAAVLVADVRAKGFGGDNLPCNVQTSTPIGFNPYAREAPVQVYATGFRNAYDLCWHSTGHLFTATNQNSIGKDVFTPADDSRKIPAVAAIPNEML